MGGCPKPWLLLKFPSDMEQLKSSSLVGPIQYRNSTDRNQASF
jgi:hypothetical protein